MRAVVRHLRAAWFEYQDIRDGIVFMHSSTARLGFENALAMLPEGKGGKRTRKAANLSDTDIRVHTHKSGKAVFSSIVARPGAGDQAALQSWISSPAIDKGGNFVSDPAADGGIEFLVASGHGSGGSIWGDGSGKSADIEVASGFRDNIDKPRSGKLKCVALPSCNNVNVSMAPQWLPMFNHDQPVHVLLGYEMTYSGGQIGASVMAKFVQKLAKDPKTPIIEAWRSANEAVGKRQPWAALAAKGGEKLNIDDWVNDKLPSLANVVDLLHFGKDSPSGTPAKVVDDQFEVRWVMSNGTVIDLANNAPTNTAVGLFPGEKGKIRIKALHPSLHFKKGNEAWLMIYLYRPTKPVDLDKLLRFDAALLAPHAATSKPVVTPEKGRTGRPEDASHVDAYRIVVPADTDTIELDFTIEKDATKQFKNDGPAGTHGRFLLDFFPPDGWDMSGDQVFSFLNSFAATTGALLRKP
jgi:hypothetical protein